MGTEIEAKLKVESLRQIENRLSELKAEFLAEQFQVDYYYDDADGTLTGGDRCLRLRNESTDRAQRFYLTYKGQRQKGRYKTRQEIEFEITDPDSGAGLFQALGYEQALVVEKKRHLWRLGRCYVALDDLPELGSFVEIEGPDVASIDEVQRMLELSDLRHIPQSYAHLVQAKRGTSD